MADTDSQVNDDRRSQELSVSWTRDRLIGRITIDGELWCAVEWSEKRQAWCIEDAEGACLTHQAHMHGQAAAKKEAVALAFSMIRDGRMPSPEQAKEARQRRLEQRRNQPAQQRRRAQREDLQQDWRRTSHAEYDADSREKAEQPLYEVMNSIFDFADPDLWKSNSFAALRPRLVIFVENAAAHLDHERACAAQDLASSDRLHRPYAERRLTYFEKRLSRALDILKHLRD
jgi:hypothetical protein